MKRALADIKLRTKWLYSLKWK